MRLKLGVRAVVELGRLEQRLRRNAADVQAGAAEQPLAFLVLPVIDARSGQAELCGTQGGGIAGRAAADDDDVEILIAHGGLYEGELDFEQETRRVLDHVFDVHEELYGLAAI